MGKCHHRSHRRLRWRRVWLLLFGQMAAMIREPEKMKAHYVGGSQGYILCRSPLEQKVKSVYIIILPRIKPQQY